MIFFPFRAKQGSESIRFVSTPLWTYWDKKEIDRNAINKDSKLSIQHKKRQWAGKSTLQIVEVMRSLEGKSINDGCR